MRFIIDRQVYPKSPSDSPFRIFRCHEVETYNPFSLKGNLSHLLIGSEYDVELTLIEENQWGKTYELAEEINIDTKNLTEADSRNILLSITTKSQTDYIMKGFPQFVQYVLDGKVDEIPVDKIYNVGKHKCKLYADLITNNYKIISIQNALKEYNLSVEECKKLNIRYQDINIINTELEAHPYVVFIDVLNRHFENVDNFICKKFPNMKHSTERCEFAILDVLDSVEVDGSTRINANECMRYIPRELLDIAVETVNNSDRIYYDKDTKYMSKMSTWTKESFVAEKLKKLIENSTELGLNVEGYINTLNECKLTEEQLNILNIVNKNNISLLMGSAGTGKSTTTKAIVDMFTKNSISFRLLAPTGIASKVLRNATGRHASTIHSAVLGLIDNPFFENVIIIDEFSMVSLDVMYMVCQHLKDSHRLIMVCDPSQLPSISCGNILTDIINSGIVPNVTLTKVFRYGTSGIATVATNIRQGVEYVDNGGTTEFDCVEKDYQFYPISSSPLEQIDKIYADLLTRYDRKDIMILSPFNKGSFGTRAINNMIQDKYNPSEHEVGHKYAKFHVNDMVINIHNNYNSTTREEFEYNNMALKNLDVDFEPHEFPQVAIMNGDIGVVTDIDDNKNVFVQFDDDEIVYEYKELHNLLLAYSISTHKSQGSQAKAVVVITHPQHSKMLNRNILYVATTRATTELIEIGSAKTINEAIKIEETQLRNTWLRELLKI